jgi:two-component system sensor histidine kinase YesM
MGWLTLRIRELKLRSKFLLAFGFIILLTILMSSVVNYYISVSAIKQNTSDYSAYLTEQIGINLEKRTKDFEQLTFQLFQQSSLPVLLGGEDGSLVVDDFTKNRVVYDFLDDLLVSHDDILASVFIDQEEKLYSLQRNARFYPVSELMKGIDLDKTWINRGKAGWFPGNGAAVLMAKALYDVPSSKYIGVVVVAVDSSQLHSIYTKVNELTLGRIIFFNDSEQPFLPLNSNDELIHHFLVNEQGKQGAGNPASFDFKGSAYLYTMTESPSDDWEIVQIVPMKEVTRGTDIIKTWTVQTTLVALAVGFLLAVWISNSITGNIRTLLKSMTQFAYDMKHRIPLSHNRDEIGVIGEKFNAMAAKIEELLDSVIEQKLLKQKAEYRTLQFEYKALQAQMNPHFLYNTLEAVHSLAKLKGDDEIGELVYLLGALLRESIGRKGDLIPLGEELAFVQKYLSIHQLIYGDKIEVSYATDSDVDAIAVPKFLLQPLVENAVIHGIEAKPGKGYIRITSCKEGDYVVLEVEDNGIGMDEEQVLHALHPESSPQIPASDKHTRVGLVSVSKRLQILYGTEHSLHIESTRGIGTRIRIKLPISREENGT